MAWFTKKADPISDRARALKNEIAAIEAQINRLDAQLVKGQPMTPTEVPVAKAEPALSTAHEPIFEDMNVDRLEVPMEAATRKAEHYNELGVRKYDLPALFSRMQNHLRGPSTTNPKLVSYLAAGGIQGLRPMRYEKRVARNRFIALAVTLFIILLGIVAAFVRQG